MRKIKLKGRWRKIKKYLVFALIALNSFSINYEATIKTNYSALFGFEGIGYPLNRTFSILKAALPRRNIYKEQLYDGTGIHPNANRTDNLVNDSTSKEPENNVPTPDPIYVPTADNKDLTLAYRYFKRSVIYDRTLLDFSLKLPDYGIDTGIKLKDRSRQRQAFNLFEVDRIYTYLNIDTKNLKLTSNYYPKGYDIVSKGFNKYYEENEVNNKLNIDGNLKVLPFNFSPAIFMKDLSIGGGYIFDIVDNDNYSLRLSQGIYKNLAPKDYDISSDIVAMTPGNHNIEYFKKWEAAKDGQSKNIGLAILDPRMGGIRAVGEYSGSLYGDSVTKTVTNEVYNIITTKFNLSPYIKKALDEGKVVDLDNIGDLLNNKLKTAFEEDKKEWGSLDSPKLQNLAQYFFDKVLWYTDIKKDNISDFSPIHLIPQEYRDIAGGILGRIVPPIPKNDTPENIKYRKEHPEPDVIIRWLHNPPNSNTNTNTNTSSNEPYYPPIITIFNDSRTAFTKGENYSEILEKIFDIVNEDILNKDKPDYFNIFKKAITLMSKKNVFATTGELLKRPEKFQAFDLYEGLTLNESESKYLSVDYLDRSMNILNVDNQKITKNTSYISRNTIEFGAKKIGLKIKENVNVMSSEKYIEFTQNSDKYDEILKTNNNYYSSFVQNENPNSNISSIKVEGQTGKITNSIFQIENRLGINIEKEKLQFNGNLLTNYMKVRNIKEIKTQLSYLKNNIINNIEIVDPNSYVNYDRFDYMFNFNLGYTFDITSRLHFNPELNFEVFNTKYIYKNISDRGNEIQSLIYTRDKNGNLIKKTNLNTTESSEFNELPAGSPVIISHYSKYLSDGDNTKLDPKIDPKYVFSPTSGYLETHISPGETRWSGKIVNIFPKINLTYQMTNNFSIGYKGFMLLSFKKGQLDSFLLKNGIEMALTLR